MDGNLRPKCILVVDDEPINLMMVYESLADQGYRIEAAPEGASAWAMLNRDDEVYDLVILDRTMPVMDGIELLKLIKGDVRLKSIPVIMHTAESESEKLTEAFSLGAYAYLIKPQSFLVINQTVSAALLE